MRHFLALRFEKRGKMKYIGHLDLLTLTQRLMALARVPIAFSQGFNPHQQMSFALPLSLGLESTGEWLEIELAEPEEPPAILERLNRAAPAGYRFVEAMALPEVHKSLASLVDAASYEAAGAGLPPECVARLFERKELIIDKKTKSGRKPEDIRGDIHQLSLEDDTLRLLLTAGSTRNVKPELILEQLCLAAGLPYRPFARPITRTGLYHRAGGGFQGLVQP